MTTDSQPPRRPAGPAPEVGASPVFWLLITLGVGTLAPCVILPEWRCYQALHMAEQAQRHRMEALQSALTEQRRVLESMRSDPGALARLAQRDLGYVRPGERVIPVSVPTVSRDSRQPFVAQPPEPPTSVARALAFLPAYDYDAVFCDERTRRLVFTMSVTLIGVALVLFRRRSA